MKILNAAVNNFASYEELEFAFADRGLTLIQGATGSGKSTLCDIVPWVLFGKTAKGGTVNEVVSWPGSEEVTARVRLEVNGKIIMIRRTRGKKGNDLLFMQEIDNPQRGKDLQDTQKLINELLGVDYDLYLSGAYFHEFSQTAQFFQTNAKTRREICEQLIDLSFPNTLQEKVKTALKTTKADLEKARQLQVTAEGNARIYKDWANSEVDKYTKWESDKQNKLASFIEKSRTFEDDTQKLIDEHTEAINSSTAINDSIYAEAIAKLEADIPKEAEKCKECGASKNNELRNKLRLELQELKTAREVNRQENKDLQANFNKLTELKTLGNYYLEQIQTLEAESNPFTEEVYALDKKYALAKNAAEKHELEHNNLLIRKADLETLTTVVSNLRSVMLENTITDIETQTNILLRDYFDGEINISLSLDLDKLETTITKDGNEAAYTQLSKGQRQLLKLSFGVAVMKAVAKHHNVKFEQLYFDESTDGMDDTTKMKAVKLLESLTAEYNSVFLVEHSETVKALVDNKVTVELVNGKSVVSA